MSENRQRWRLAFSRGEEARYLAHLDAVKAWERALRRGRIPIALSEGFSPRPRLVFAAPLPLGMFAEHELADLYLADRLSKTDLRERLARNLPIGYRLIDLHDVWVGAPSLATQLAAADYRIVVDGAPTATLRAAVAQLLGADRLDREKRREDKAVAYDLRPLLLRLEVEPVAMSTSAITIRLRHSQDLGSGRAEEVVAALGEACEPRADLEMAHAIRERLWLAGELAVGSDPDGEADGYRGHPAV